MMKETLIFRLFGTIALLCLFLSSEAQVKSHRANIPAAGAKKLWSPLAGTGLQHALANASRRHFEVKSQNSKVKTNEPVAGNDELIRMNHQRLMAKR